jgi:hypothetical protein
VPLHTLLGQTASNVPVGGIEELIWRFGSSLGALGILAWYFYQTQTKTIPEKDKQIAEERAASDEKVKSVVASSTQEIRMERESHKNTVDQLVGELRSEREARMAIIRQCDRDRHGRES